MAFPRAHQQQLIMYCVQPGIGKTMPKNIHITAGHGIYSYHLCTPRPGPIIVGMYAVISSCCLCWCSRVWRVTSVWQQLQIGAGHAHMTIITTNILVTSYSDHTNNAKLFPSRIKPLPCLLIRFPCCLMSFRRPPTDPTLPPSFLCRRHNLSTPVVFYEGLIYM